MLKIDINLSAWVNADKMLKEHAIRAPRFLDTAVAKVGVEGRKDQKSYGGLKMGGDTSHGTHKGGTRWDSARGYVAKSTYLKDGSPMKMSYFSFRKSAMRGSNESVAYLTDRLANLFERSHTWSADSPYFTSNGYRARIKEGYVSKRRGVLSNFTAYSQILDKAVEKTWTNIMGGIN